MLNTVWGSPFNTVAAAQSRGTDRVFLADCTLRDGEQQAGLVFDKASRIEIAEALDDLGVYEIEAGIAASTADDREAIKEICRMRLRSKVSVLCRARVDDIDQAVLLGVWAVRLSFPISRIQREHKLKGISDDEYLRKALAITKYARDKGLYVIFSPYDTTRADPAFLRRVVDELADVGTVDRLRIVDTVGCAVPEAIAYIVRELRTDGNELPLEIHCHDDFGLACANTVAGVLAGAEFVSTTINGIGERSGNAATEEVCTVLELMYGIQTGVTLSSLTEISRLVSARSRVGVQPHKPVVGENSFRHEAGMVVAGVGRDPSTAEPYAPELVGQRRQVILGKKSGTASIHYKLNELSLATSEDRIQGLLERVREIAIRERRSLTDEEFVCLYAEYERE